jgi:DNA-binding CsgD family transcriptional regulator
MKDEDKTKSQLTHELTFMPKRLAELEEIESERKRAEEDLKLERKNLAEANAALKVLLRHREEDRRELEEALLTNVKNLLLPFAEKLKNTRLTPDQVLFLEIVESHLKDITSPFLRTLTREYARLTPMEIRVADLIRDDRMSKEIAQILGISENSVLFHRKNLRRKFGLRGKKANLKSHFVSLS